jgi:RNA-directed DNA polymerase
MSRIARKITDKVLLRAIGRYLRAGVLVEGTIEPTEWGTPQGSPLSPLLSNILLDDLDKELEARGHRFVRYMDDLVILVKSRRAGRRVMAKISCYSDLAVSYTNLILRPGYGRPQSTIPAQPSEDAIELTL